MRVLFDTDIILDVLLLREPHAEAATSLMSLVDRGKVEGLLCATTVTTIAYLGAKALGSRKAAVHVRNILSLFEVAPVDGLVLAQALDQSFPDFEDAVLHESGRMAGANAIVTRNGKDFARASLPILSPQELLAIAAASQDKTR